VVAVGETMASRKLANKWGREKIVPVQCGEGVLLGEPFVGPAMGSLGARRWWLEKKRPTIWGKGNVRKTSRRRRECHCVRFVFSFINTRRSRHGFHQLEARRPRLAGDMKRRRRLLQCLGRKKIGGDYVDTLHVAENCLQ
jgi:hypothetical protein